VFLVPVEPINFLTPLEDVVLKDVGVRAEFKCEISKSGLRPTWFKGATKLRKSDSVTISSEDKVWANKEHKLYCIS
jgi:hypothetical protein